MEKYAQIPKISKGLVFSDPGYDEAVWCQYRRDFQARDWLMKMESHADAGILNFSLKIGRPTVQSWVRAEETETGFKMFCPNFYDVKEAELGMDTARIFCGQRENWDSFAEEASIHTMSDGFFGDLMEYTCKGENTPAGYLLVGYMDADVMDEQELFQHFAAGFDAQEISHELYSEKIAPQSLEFRIAASSELNHAKQGRGRPPSEPEKGLE